MYDPRYDRHFEQYLVREGSKEKISRVIELFSAHGVDLKTFESLRDALGDNQLAGAYLAGVIDGDGCIQLRKNYYDQHVETLLKVSTNIKSPLVSLQQLFASVGLPKGYISPYPGHYDLWLYLSKSSKAWFKHFVSKQLAIKRKSLRIK